MTDTSRLPEEQKQITPEALSGGFKADAGKARLDLIPVTVLRELLATAINSEFGEPSALRTHLERVAQEYCDFWDNPNADPVPMSFAIEHANEALMISENITYAAAVLQLGELYAIGAKKYADRNWEKGMDWGRCFAAGLRHFLKFVNGESHDVIDGQHHLISVVWCAAALHHFAANPDEYKRFDTRKVITVAPDNGQK